MFLGLIVSALMLSMVTHYHYSAFGQSSTTTSAGPATTTPPPLSQSNTTSSSSVDEGVVVVNSLLFEPDGTGLIRLRSNGTVGPLIPFTHNFTEANGYTIYSSVPFFANNGSAVDLNSIDFSSQIIIDPGANVTLPARPMLSPAVVPDISSLPPPSSQRDTAPATLASPPQSQQPTQTAPPTTASPPTTQSTPSTSGVIIDRPTAARLAAEDPYFARFEQILENCNNLLFGTATIMLEQCVSSIQSGADRWCGFEFYDQLKCEYASFMAQQYNKMQGILGDNLFNEVFPEGLLAPTP